MKQRRELDDIDRNISSGCFRVWLEAPPADKSATDGAIRINVEEFGNWLSYAGKVDAFDGELLIWFGDDEFYRDQNFDLQSRRGRDRSKPIDEFIRHDMEESLVIEFLMAAKTETL